MDAQNRATIVDQSQVLMPGNASSASNFLSDDDSDSDSILYCGSIASIPPNERVTPAEEVNSEFETATTERSNSVGSHSAGQLSPSGPLSEDYNDTTLVTGTIVNTIPTRRVFFAEQLESNIETELTECSYSVGSHCCGRLSPCGNSNREVLWRALNIRMDVFIWSVRWVPCPGNRNEVMC